MEILILRDKRDAFTCGTLYVNGEYFCDTLERRCIDWSKQKKIPGMTAIPDGRYEVEIKVSPSWHRPMPYLLNVPHFRGIMIHPGNTPADSKGCILVGSAFEWKSCLFDSRLTFNRLFNKIDSARIMKELVFVTLQDRQTDRQMHE